MSGGVDSSVAAARLAADGEDVFGIMLRLWSRGPDRPNRCCSPADMDRARQVAAQLDIPFYVLDVKDLFKDIVVDYFTEGYAQGRTPNPCIECNRTIRWEYMFEQALAMGATHLATGHYAAVRQVGTEFILQRAHDRNKDQSYVLSVLRQEQLRRALFPLGDLTKSEVRELAQRLELPVALRPESQDLCFIGGRDYREFLEEQGVMLEAGPIKTTDGTLLGEHEGLPAYTIGQRKGIGVSAPDPLYVLGKRAETNTLIVGPRRQLARDTFEIGSTSWTASHPPGSPFYASVQIRYRAPEVAARCQAEADQKWRVETSTPLYDITPGQSAVFYSGDTVLGGGIIQG